MAYKTSIAELSSLLTTPYSHLELGQVNDHAAYVMNFKNVYPMHRHIMDELYLVLEGEITIRFKNEAAPITLRKGESTVVRAYTTHSSESLEGALVLMVKPKEMFPHPSEVE
jgi:mannose-6-phosphate isomerase-like protein (cupin superfamily)